MRVNQTEPEEMVWELVRGERLGFKFRRQHGIGDFIVDFYCPKKKLVIEVDGKFHKEQKEQDDARDAILKSDGLKIVRIDAFDVYNDIEGVRDAIWLHLYP